MIKLTAVKTEGFVQEGKEYLFGALTHGSENVLLMDEKKNILPGRYTLSTFGLTKEELLSKVKGDNNE